jgi:hypothetical protein
VERPLGDAANADGDRSVSKKLSVVQETATCWVNLEESVARFSKAICYSSGRRYEMPKVVSFPYGNKSVTISERFRYWKRGVGNGPRKVAAGKSCDRTSASCSRRSYGKMSKRLEHVKARNEKTHRRQQELMTDLTRRIICILPRTAV